MILTVQSDIVHHFADDINLLNYNNSVMLGSIGVMSQILGATTFCLFFFTKKSTFQNIFMWSNELQQIMCSF